MKKIPISLICGIAAILITILLYAVILQSAFLQAMCFVTLAGVVLSEIVTTAFAVLAKGNPRKVAAAVISSFTVPLALVLSVVYIASFPNGYATYVGWYTVSMIAVNVIAVILYRFDAQKTEENTALQSAKTNMLNLRKMVKLIMSDPAAQDVRNDLYRLEEKLHFSNDGVIAPQDSSIYEKLAELRENVGNADYDKKAAIEAISKAVDERNIFYSRSV